MQSWCTIFGARQYCSERSHVTSDVRQRLKIGDGPFFHPLCNLRDAFESRSQRGDLRVLRHVDIEFQTREKALHMHSFNISQLELKRKHLKIKYMFRNQLLRGQIDCMVNNRTYTARLAVRQAGSLDRIANL